MSEPHSFQSVIIALEKYWADYGCLIWQPYNHQVGAGTMNPATALRVLGPEPWNVAYVEPSVRPDDGRYGRNPNRLQQHYQYQVILKPDPGDPQEVYLASLEAIGINPREHDIRFVEDNWESPAIGAWGLGWEVWLDGQEITQFTYFQQAGGLQLDPVSVEITYGLERIVMSLQRVNRFTEVRWADQITYGDVNLQAEQEHSRYYFEIADVERLRTIYNLYEAESEAALAAGLVLPAYDYVLKCSHTFNVLDTRGAIGVTERAAYFKRMRGLTRRVAEAYVEQRQRLEFPLLDDGDNDSEGVELVVPAASEVLSDTTTYLLEIGVEELPAADLDDLIEQLSASVPQHLADLRLTYAHVNVQGTPRRLVVIIEGLLARQPDTEELVRGPAVHIAFDSSGEPTKAALGFARGKGLSVADLERREMDGGKYVAAVVRTAGRSLTKVLVELAPKLIAALKVKRTMRWRAEDQISFSRPIRWIVSLAGEIVVPFEYAGLQAGRVSRTIRPQGGQALPIPAAESYFVLLAENAIMVNREARREYVRAEAQRLAAEVDGVILDDPDLLAEVANLIESPTAFRGEFDTAFLELPKEVLISVMRKHQRYFPVSRAGELLPYFIGVRNGDEEHLDLVVEGNEAVILARFADARYFVQQDQEKTLVQHRERLRLLAFQEQLGSMFDKSDRIEKLVETLTTALGLSAAHHQVALRAGHLCKADLVTSMVVEMTSLQGVMGREYALQSDDSSEVAAVIEQHYWPLGGGGALPESGAAVVVALADRMDSLAGLFAAGLSPTGSADPFGLRRAALGSVQILIGKEIDFDLRAALQTAIELQPIEAAESVLAEVLAFIAGRLRVVLQDSGCAHDIVEAVLAERAHNPYRAQQAAQELSEWVSRSDWEATLDAYARCVRITRGRKDTERLEITPGRFEETVERELHAAYLKTAALVTPDSNVNEFMQAFTPLIPAISCFFDDVLVMVEDEGLRDNRFALLEAIAALTDGIVDLSKMEGF